MSVLIKGMKLPKDCESCTVAHLADCELWIKAGYRQRHKDCPLIEVPPHGRLIDADKVKNDIREYVDKYGTIEIKITKFNIILERAQFPTIIEAEEGEDNDE